VEALLAGVSAEHIAEAGRRTTALYASIHAARNLRAEFKIQAKQQVRFLIAAKGDLSSTEQAVFASLAKASEVVLLDGAAPAGTPSVLTDIGTIYLPLEGLIDLEAEKKRVLAEITKVEAEIAKVEAKLNDSSFVEKVPAAVLEDHRTRQVNWNEKLETLKATRATLE
jgi:valyl-tRNA synthetase